MEMYTVEIFKNDYRITRWRNVSKHGLTKLPDAIKKKIGPRWNEYKLHYNIYNKKTGNFVKQEQVN